MDTLSTPLSRNLLPCQRFLCPRKYLYTQAVGRFAPVGRRADHTLPRPPTEPNNSSSYSGLILT